MEPEVHLEPKPNDELEDNAQSSLTHSLSRSLVAPQKQYCAGIRWLIASGTIAGLGIGGWFAYQYFLKSAAKPIAVSVLNVNRGTVELTISESGTVELASQQVLKSPEDVTVEQVFVQSGDRVQVGAPLIVLRNREVQQRLQAQLIEQQKFQADLARKREIVQERRRRLQNAQQRLQELQAALNQGVIPAAKVQEAQDAADQAQSGVKDAEIDQHKAALDVQKAQMALQDIQQQLGDNRLNSPIEALILQVDVKPGDGAKRETPLLTLGDPTQEMIRLQLTTLNASKVRINQVARVSMIGPNPPMFRGRVVGLSPQAAAQKSENAFSSQSQAKVDASVALDRPSNRLIPGSQVSVEIVLQQRQRVLTLPLEAIQQTEAQPFVWIKTTAGVAEKRPVQLGLQSLTTAEITSGLQEGESVVLPLPNQTIAPGSPLQDTPVPSASLSPTP